MRAGERAKMCAKIITLRNQQKCTILDPKIQIIDSFGIHSVKVLVQVHYFRVFLHLRLRKINKILIFRDFFKKKKEKFLHFPTFSKI